ncbi:unnamed protein product [Albugo candida]|uniref:Uncharacterized protein n=1 Tax=Albugo candida TaxID=65357 RepID=A0A024GLN4_9STRA|nr:unnamed protein product [Albugo candida]|eukprot:CCI47646.1 unnamed protein product [Albugo candida]
MDQCSYRTQGRLSENIETTRIGRLASSLASLSPPAYHCLHFSTFSVVRSVPVPETYSSTDICWKLIGFTQSARSCKVSPNSFQMSRSCFYPVLFWTDIRMQHDAMKAKTCVDNVLFVRMMIRVITLRKEPLSYTLNRLLIALFQLFDTAIYQKNSEEPYLLCHNMLLSWLNFALFGVQVFVNSQHARQIGPASRRHNTPLTPAPYAFRIWGLIYSLLVPTLILDCMYPKYSFFDLSNDPNSLRVAFSLSCVANISWILLFPRNFVHTSSIIIIILWLSLLPLYISITDSWQQNQFSWIRFLGSELSIMIYCAWACIAASISVSISEMSLGSAVVPSKQ